MTIPDRKMLGATTDSVVFHGVLRLADCKLRYYPEMVIVAVETP